VKKNFYGNLLGTVSFSICSNSTQKYCKIIPDFNFSFILEGGRGEGVAIGLFTLFAFISVIEL
jgi:hypothetical protein